MPTSTRLPSGGTIFAISLPSLARMVDTWLVRMSPGLGTSTITYAIANVMIGSSTASTAVTASPRRTHFQLILTARVRGRPGGPDPGARRTAAAGRRRRLGGGVPSSAALTTSIGSRRRGSPASVTGGRTMVSRSSGAGGRAWTGRRTAGRWGPAATRRASGRLAGGARRFDGRRSRLACGGAPARQRPVRWGLRSLTCRGALRYSLAVRAPERAVGCLGALGSLGGHGRAQHVGLDQMIPTARPTHLDDVDLELGEARGQQHQFLGAAGRPGGGARGDRRTPTTRA